MKKIKIYTEYFRRYDEYFIFPYISFNNISRRSGLYEIGFGFLHYGFSVYLQKE